MLDNLMGKLYGDGEGSYEVTGYEVTEVMGYGDSLA